MSISESGHVTFSSMLIHDFIFFLQEGICHGENLLTAVEVLVSGVPFLPLLVFPYFFLNRMIYNPRL